MNNSVKAIPDGYRGATPYLRVKNAAAAIEFYKQAFGATELYRITDPHGKIGHAEFKIGDAIVMICDEHPDMGIVGPESLGGSSVTIHLYFENVDAVAAQAVAAGAIVAQPVADQFYGDRGARFIDPFGHHWSLATHIEDVAPEEMKKRAAALFGGG